MRKKYCQDCHKHPIAFVTRKDKDSKKRYVCKSCSVKYLEQGIVSYHNVPEPS